MLFQKRFYSFSFLFLSFPFSLSSVVLLLINISHFIFIVVGLKQKLFPPRFCTLSILEFFSVRVKTSCRILTSTRIRFVSSFSTYVICCHVIHGAPFIIDMIFRIKLNVDTDWSKLPDCAYEGCHEQKCLLIARGFFFCCKLFDMFNLWFR